MCSTVKIKIELLDLKVVVVIVILTWPMILEEAYSVAKEAPSISYMRIVS